MTLALQQVNASGLRVFCGTLTHGAEVHSSLAAVAHPLNVTAGTFDLLGGLTEAEFSEYDFVTHTRKSPLTFRRALEVVSGQGTLSWLEGEPFVHLHLVCAFRDETQPHGIALVGGHCARALAFAVEFTLTAYDGLPLQRALHAGTGLKLWDVPELRP